MPTIAEKCAALLQEHGPLSLDDLLPLALASGITKAKNPRAALSQALDRAHEVLRLGDRYVARAELLRGRRLTHRVTAEELEEQCLRARLDLEPLRLRWHTSTSSNRGPVTVSLKDRMDLVLTGPAGWLSDVRAGDLLSFEVVDQLLDIQVVTRAITEPMTDGALFAQLEDMLRPYDGFDDEPPTTSIAAPVHLVMQALPAAFASPGLPLSERLAGRYETRRELVGHLGTDWDTADWLSGWLDDADEDRFEVDDELDDDVQAFARGLGLDASRTSLLGDLVDAVDDLADGELLDDLRVRRLLSSLDDRLATAFLAWSRNEGDPRTLLPFGLLLADAARGPAAAVWLTLAALAAEELQDHAQAQELVDRAVTADPRHATTREVAARYASDRGDAPAALAHLRAAGLPHDHPDVRRMARFAEAPPGSASRNAPCPCGSGKKHKQCCLGSLRHPLVDRAPWLWQKLAEWMREPAQRMPVLQVVQRMHPEAGGMQVVAMAMNDPGALDAAAWSTRLVHDFLARRGPMLPDDERDLLAQWCAALLSFVEVVSTKPGHSLVVRDRETGHESVVREKLGSSSVRPGDLLATRLLPAGNGETSASFVLGVPPGHAPAVRAALRGKDPELALADWFAAAQRPPELRNKRGHELVMCTGTWDVPGDALSRLEAELGPAHDRSVTLLDGDSIVATLTVDEGTLTVTSMSREDYGTAAALVRRLVPGATETSLDALPGSAVVSGQVTSLRSKRQDGPDLSDSPEVQAVIRAKIEEYERSWCDESIPAFGGRTPRQMLAAPSTRQEVVDMLDSWPETPNGMSPTRVRKLLGLDG